MYVTCVKVQTKHFTKKVDIPLARQNEKGSIGASKVFSKLDLKE